LSKPLADGEYEVSVLASAGQSRPSPLDPPQTGRHSRNSSVFHWRVQGSIGRATVHLSLVPAAAPICADDFGAASYVSPPP
jgi:hypothetical protein